MRPINVLSTFDGISCGQLALQRAGINVKNYYASEIDKYAISITQKNFPDTIQLGSVENWKSWKLPKIDLLIGGSPCQGFSNAGLGLNFDDPRSKLFFTYVDIRNELRRRNPDLKFLLENVKMKKAWREIITEYMGVEPVLVNSALVSAQNRERLYWTNWEFDQPENLRIFLKDIIENGIVDREKSYTVDANYFKGGNPRSYFEDGKRQLVFKHQSHRRAMAKVPNPKPSKNGIIFVAGLEDSRRLHDGKNLSRNFGDGYRVYSSNGKFPSLYAMPKGGEGGYTGLIQVGTDNEYQGHDIQKRVYSDNGKSPSLMAITSGGPIPPKVAVDEIYYRKLTPLECERLQTLPDGYTEGVSNTQRYKCLGNGWTVDVIAHIFSYLK